MMLKDVIIRDQVIQNFKPNEDLKIHLGDYVQFSIKINNQNYRVHSMINHIRRI